MSRLKRRLANLRAELEARAEDEHWPRSDIQARLAELCQGLPLWALRVLAGHVDADQLLAGGIGRLVSRGDLEQTPAGGWQPGPRAVQPDYLVDAICGFLNLAESNMREGEDQ